MENEFDTGIETSDAFDSEIPLETAGDYGALNDSTEPVTDVTEDIFDNAAEDHIDEIMEDIPEDIETASTDYSDDSPSSKLNDAELFAENRAGDYTYTETDYGKQAAGQLELEKGERNAYAQRTVGGDDRQEFDDGGHLIGNRFCGDGGYENLDAQSRELNRGEYKKMENEWADSLSSGEKVYVDVNTYKSNDSDRPDAYMGYSITEDGEGNRTLDTFSFQNESNETQEGWEKIVSETDMPDNYSNAMDYTDEQKKLIDEIEE